MNQILLGFSTLFLQINKSSNEGDGDLSNPNFFSLMGWLLALIILVIRIIRVIKKITKEISLINDKEKSDVPKSNNKEN
ncbi:MAG: hypothetical protein ACKO5Y_02905 [Bacteroidota bacterium]